MRYCSENVRKPIDHWVESIQAPTCSPSNGNPDLECLPIITNYLITWLAVGTMVLIACYFSGRLIFAGEGCDDSLEGTACKALK
jgi:hypothetical protein